MLGSFTLFEVRGVPIRVHFTTIFLLLWIQQPGIPLWLTLAIVTVLLGSITLHELGHTLVAQRYGIAVQDIVLTPIGGVARLSRSPEDSRQEVRIALAGPLVSLALALFSATLYALSTVLQSGLLFGFATLAFRINLILLLFNLLPNFPMDGGRVLRGLLTPRKGRLEATRIATEIGKYVSGAFIVLGLLMPGYRSLILIGLFMFVSASTEYRLLLFNSWQDPAGSADNDFSASPPPYAQTLRDPSGLWADLRITLQDLLSETRRAFFKGP